MQYQVICADALEGLKRLESGSVHTCVTSPPYYGLRDYGVDGQIGLEQTPEEYITRLVSVFREVRRALRDDGTLWVNIGDSYNSTPPGNKNPMSKSGLNGAQTSQKYKDRLVETQQKQQERRGLIAGIKPKDLIGIPWMLAFALRADGWYLRQDIIWAKPNPMPESVTDRCTKSHEYIFLLSKSKQYYYDNKAIMEPVSELSLKRAEYGWDCDRPSTKNASLGGEGIHTDKMGTRFVNPDGRNKRSVWTVATKPFKGSHFAVFPPDLILPCVLAGAPESGTVCDPFTGSGTTGIVALENGREFVGCELNPVYAEMARKRISKATQQLKIV